MQKLRQQVVTAIKRLRSAILWKSGKDVEHIQTRKQYGHLPTDADINTYEAIISAVLRQPAADVYVFLWEDDTYPTVVGTYNNQRWLVMFSLSGVMETAFPPTNPDEYLADRRFHYLGTIEELAP